MDNKTWRSQMPALELSNLLSFVGHAITNYTRKYTREGVPSDGTWVNTPTFNSRLRANGQDLRRQEGYDDICLLVIDCPMLMDYIHDLPFLIALCLLSEAGKRVESDFVEEVEDGGKVTKFVVRAHQGHKGDKSTMEGHLSTLPHVASVKVRL